LRKFGVKNKLGKENKNICSELVQQYMKALGDNLPIVTPQDVLRFMNENYEVIV